MPPLRTEALYIPAQISGRTKSTIKVSGLISEGINEFNENEQIGASCLSYLTETCAV